MECRKSGDSVAIRLDPGEEIVGKVTGFCASEGIGCAVVSAIGACREAEISHFDTIKKGYHSKKLEGMLEIVSLSGNICRLGSEPVLHAHIALGLPDFSIQGGHLVRAVVDPTCEISMRIIDIGLKRERDEGTGLNLQRF